MVCLLYNDVLCLASAGKVDQIYTVHACLSLRSVKVEEVDNGRGRLFTHAAFSSHLFQDCNAIRRPFPGSWFLNATTSSTKSS